MKDLRAQFAIYAKRAGIGSALLQQAMGHATPQMQLRYEAHSTQMSADDAEAVATAMGLKREAEMKRVAG